MHESKLPNVQREAEIAAATPHAKLLELLHDARHQADDAGLDLVAIRISEAIDLLPVAMR